MATAAPCPVLVERDDELAVLRALAREVVGGDARLVVVSGPAGAGKSRLIQAFGDGLGPPWHRLTADTTDVDPTTRRPLAQVVDRARSVDATASALVEVLGGLLDRSPLVLEIDGLEELDAATIGAVGTAFDAHRRRPLLLVVGVRSGAASLASPVMRAVAALASDRAATELVVPPLTARGIAAMATAMGVAQAIDPGVVLDRTDGNPYLVEAVLRAGDDRRAVDEWVRDALAQLSDEAEALAELLAVAGLPLPTTVLRQVDPDGAGAAALIAAGFAVTADDRHLGLRHALLGEALRAGLTDAHRTALHVRLARCYDAVADHPDQVARHWASAGDLDRAAPAALEAADRFVRVRRAAAAVDLYERALRWRTPAMPPEAEIAERLFTAAVHAGEGDRAALVAASLRASDHPAAPGRWGNPHFHRVALATSDGRATPDDRPAPQIEDRVARARAAVTADELPAALAIARGAFDDAIAAGELVLGAEAAMVMTYAGDPAQALELLGRVESAARASGTTGAVTVSLTRRARTLLASGDLLGAIEASSDALEVAKRSGRTELWSNVQIGTASLLAQRGEYDRAAVLSAEVRATGSPIAAVFADAADWTVAVMRSDASGAGELTGRVLPLARSFGDEYFLVPCLMLAARSAEMAGATDEAAALVDEALEAAWSPLHEQMVDLLVSRATIGFARGDGDAVRSAGARLAELHRSLPGPGIGGAAELVRGVSFLVADDHERASVALGRARRRLAAAGRVPLADIAARLAAPLGGASGSTTAAFDGLDERQRRVADLVARGRTNREVAAALHLAEKTVRNTLSEVFRELGVSRRTELVALVHDERSATAAAGARPSPPSVTSRRPSGDGPAERALPDQADGDDGGLREVAALATLGDGARRLADALAVAVDPLPLEAVAIVLADPDPGELHGTVEELRTCALVRSTPDAAVATEGRWARALRSGWGPVGVEERRDALAALLERRADRLTAATPQAAASRATLTATAAGLRLRTRDDLRAALSALVAGDAEAAVGRAGSALAWYGRGVGALLDRGEVGVPGSTSSRAIGRLVEHAVVVSVDAGVEPPEWLARGRAALGGTVASSLGADPDLRAALEGAPPPAAADAPGVGPAAELARAAAAVVRAIDAGERSLDDPGVQRLDDVARLLPDPTLVELVGRARARWATRAANRAATQVPGLTRRESEVARLAAEGLTNHQIGAALGLSPATVRNYLTSAFGKLGVTRRSQLPAVVGRV